jgi:carboxymethylenebutenolidase
MKKSTSANISHEGSRNSRRDALKAIISLMGGYAFTQPLITSVLAATTAEPRPDLDVNEANVQYRSGQATIDGYLVRPKSEGQHPAVVVIHSVTGLDNNIKDLTRQLATKGFVALAPNLASRDGKSTVDQGATIAHLDPLRTVLDVKLGYEFLASDSGVDPGRISAIGFGWGGWRAFMLAETVPELYRAVVYYGSTPTEGLETIKAPVLAQYAENDFRVTGNALWTEKTMKELGKTFTYVVYGDADAEFMSKPDTQPDADAARISWQKTLEFLRFPS